MTDDQAAGHPEETEDWLVRPRQWACRLLRPARRCFAIQVRGGHRRLALAPLDVLFLFDSSASMGDVLAAVTEEAREVMQFIRGLSAESAYAVAAFNDYPELTKNETSYPWRLYQDFSPDAEATRAALARVEEGYGGDLPEACSRALWEARGLSWRERSHKYILLFGDAPAKDPDFYGVALSPDPGPDGQTGTADDLRLRDVVAALAERKIRIIAIHDTRFGQEDKDMLELAIKGFEYMAKETSGMVKPIGAAADVGRAIREALREQYVQSLKLAVDGKYDNWIEQEPSRADGAEATEVTFPICIRPPRETRSGTYRFAIRAIIAEDDGIRQIGATQVTVRIGLWSHPLGWALLPFLAPLWLLGGLLLFAVTGGPGARRRFHDTGYRWQLVIRALTVTVLLLLVLGWFFS